MPTKTSVKRSASNDDDPFAYSIPVTGLCQSANSSRTFLNYDGLNFEGWAPKGGPVSPLHPNGKYSDTLSGHGKLLLSLHAFLPNVRHRCIWNEWRLFFD